MYYFASSSKVAKRRQGTLTLSFNSPLLLVTLSKTVAIIQRPMSPMSKTSQIELLVETYSGTCSFLLLLLISALAVIAS